MFNKDHFPFSRFARADEATSYKSRENLSRGHAQES
jgi:hypothetical protein